MSRWLRFYDDAINDPKILKLPEAMRWYWTAVLCIASKYNGQLPGIEDVALLLRVAPQKAASILASLATAGLLDKTETGFAPHNWNGRQYKSDVTDPTGALRAKKYRDGKKRVVTRDDRDATVTHERPETETETEKKELSRSKPTERAPSRFGEFWQAYPRRDGPNPRKDAEIKFNRMVKSGINPQTMIDAAKQLAIDEQRRGNVGTRFIPQAVTWLNGQRWIDHAAEVLDKKFEDDGLIEVIEDDALSAWDAYSRAKNGKTFPRNARGGWRFPSKYPPGYQPQTGEASPPVIPQLSRMSPQPGTSIRGSGATS